MFGSVIIAPKATVPLVVDTLLLRIMSWVAGSIPFDTVDIRHFDVAVCSVSFSLLIFGGNGLVVRANRSLIM